MDALAPRIVFANQGVAPTHDGGFEGLPLGTRAGIETAEQAVEAVRAAQSRGNGLLGTVLRLKSEIGQELD